MANNLRRPMLYTNITVQFLKNKNWETPEVCKGVVASGSMNEISGDIKVKHRVIKQLRGKDVAKKFDYSKVIITKIEKIKELGKGWMQANKS